MKIRMTAIILCDNYCVGMDRPVDQKLTMCILYCESDVISVPLSVCASNFHCEGPSLSFLQRIIIKRKDNG